MVSAVLIHNSIEEMHVLCKIQFTNIKGSPALFDRLSISDLFETLTERFEKEMFSS